MMVMNNANETPEVENDMLQEVDLCRLGQELSYTERTVTNGIEVVVIEVANVLVDNQPRMSLTLLETGSIMGFIYFYYHRIEEATGCDPDDDILNGVQETELVRLYRARLDHYRRA